MPDTGSTPSNPDNDDERSGSDQHPQRADAVTPPPVPRQDHRDDPQHDVDEPEDTGRDWPDDQGGRGAPPPSADDHDRRSADDDGTARPVHAGAGPVGTVGRSSSWGPVLSGAATAFVVFLVFTALWVAIAASGAHAIGDNLEWFQLSSAVLAAAAGGAAAGWLDPRGTMTGMIQGLATWGLLVLAVTVAGLTTGTALLGAVGTATLDANIQATSVTELLQPFERELWALFTVLLGGALIAGLAGALTGRTHTRLALDDQTRRDEAADSGDRVIDVRTPADSGARDRNLAKLVRAGL